MKIVEEYFSNGRCVEEEHSDLKLNVTKGEIPADLKGTLYHNGPGRMEHFGVKYQHIFDGDGMITAFRFSEGEVMYSNRYVRTQEWQKEKEKGKFLYRGFGTNKPGGIKNNFLDMHFKNVANTSIVYHAGKLLALWEGGLPHLIDPKTLETIGRYDYDEVLRNDFSFIDKKMSPELPFSSHPKISYNRTLYNFGTAAGTKNRLLHYEITSSGKAKIAHITPLDNLNFTHDFILTEEGYKIFFLTPVQFDVFKTFLGLSSPAASMKTDPDAKIRILVLDPDYKPVHLETESSFIFHFINGYKSANEIIVDGLMLREWPGAEAMTEFLSGDIEEAEPFIPTRFRLNLESKEVKKEIIVEYGMEFPAQHPNFRGKNYTYAWGVAAPLNNNNIPALLDGLIKLNLKDPSKSKYKSLKGYLPGEPFFVPRSGKEDDGILILPMYNGDKQITEIHGYAAKDLDHIFTAELPHNLLLGFHSIWVADD